ncbi:hypothetical protein [Dyadobacter sp. CY312]|uniref:hypothetical protein n=1 Tax=Dyadobacter sp. CY312 TaxID=2907303 RepID=UPI001F1C0F28|nr:hypothetical protein [Dyadobacter sp. CY312]MCE7044111.1 hypothetical protein [Dyadobacter sp. CY312]
MRSKLWFITYGFKAEWVQIDYDSFLFCFKNPEIIYTSYARKLAATRLPCGRRYRYGYQIGEFGAFDHGISVIKDVLFR